MNKVKKFIKTPYFRIIIAALTLLIIIIAVSGYIYDSLAYRKPFYIAYNQYPGDPKVYIPYSPTMEGREPHHYNGLEFIGWYYIDENGNEKEFIPEEFTPPENPELNYMNVYGRWKSVPLDEEKQN